MASCATKFEGLRLFATRGWQGKLRQISLSIVDPRVWFPLLAVQELLSSDLITYGLDVENAEGHIEHIHATLTGSPRRRIPGSGCVSRQKCL